MNTSDFTSNFWNIYVAVIIVISFLGLIWLLISQNKVKKTKNEQVETMGHVWDGIEEYNNPLPRWWFYLFVITVIFSIVYLVLYPGFASFPGTKGWTSHNAYDAEVKEAREHFQPIYSQFADKSIEQIAADPQAKVIGQNLFNTYCIQCHGSDAKGAKGFPNLTDHDWLWGGDPQSIQDTIRGGRIGIMLPYGGLPAFPEDSVKDVAHYIYSLNENEGFRSRANPTRAQRGKVIYDQICFTCHQADGKGMVGLAPNLTDDVWLWGSREKDLVSTISHGHTNEMPAWENFLVDKHDGKEDNSKLRILAAYVWGLSNPNGQAAVATPAEEPVAIADEVAGADESATATDSATTDDNAAKVVSENGIVKFYFASSSADLASGADAALAEIVQGVQDGKNVMISGFHDQTGDPISNALLAKQRAEAVAAALEALGVSTDKIQLTKPEMMVGEGSNAEARRVEVSLI